LLRVLVRQVFEVSEGILYVTGGGAACEAGLGRQVAGGWGVLATTAACHRRRWGQNYFSQLSDQKTVTYAAAPGFPAAAGPELGWQSPVQGCPAVQPREMPPQGRVFLDGLPVRRFNTRPSGICAGVLV